MVTLVVLRGGQRFTVWEAGNLIRIRELYRLQTLKGLRLIAGREGLERTVTAAVLFEYDPSRMQLADFYRGDLVVTTLAYARSDEQLMTQSLLALMNQGIAGLLVKTAYFSELPHSVIERADELGAPLFLFDDTYIEEAILEVTDLIRGKRHFAGFEQEIDALMRGELTPEQARERAARIDPSGEGAYLVCALYPRERMPELDEKLYALLCGDAKAARRLVVMEWRRMMLMLCRLEAGEGEQAAQEEILALLERAQLPADRLLIGLSRAREDQAELGIAFSEAVYAARAAKLEGRNCLGAQELGLYAWLFPMSENAFVCEQCRRSLASIRAYDAQNHAALEQTARVYVREHMEVSATARALYQHPNTIRYRLSKIQRLMDMEGDALFEPMLCLLFSFSRVLGEEDKGGA